MKDWQYILKNLSLLSQMGISLAAPLLLCLFLCSWLNSRFMIGGWIYIPGFIDRKSTRLNSSHVALSRMPSSA